MTREKSTRDDKPPFHAMSPRPWHGMTITDWLRLLVSGRFAVSTTRLPLAVSVSLFTLLNSMLRPLENLAFGRDIEEVKLEHPPLFIVGHWRTGTTLLHELVVQDEQFSFASHLQATTPHHFLSAAWFTGQALRPFLPKRRPMDNMAIRLHLPQEDEIALMVLGLPSPYLSWAWPNGPDVGEHSLTLEGLSDDELERWKATFLRLVKRLALKDPRRLVLKSPTHTARLKTLLELFPDAQFIHIVRDPLDVFPSMVRTWKRLQYMFGLQVPRYEGLEEYLLDFYSQMYEAFERDRELVAPSQLYELHYEDLVRDPKASMRSIYEHLELGDFDRVVPRLTSYFDSHQGYRTNRFELSDQQRCKIAERWAPYMQKYGYADAMAPST